MNETPEKLLEILQISFFIFNHLIITQKLLMNKMSTKEIMTNRFRTDIEGENGMMGQ